MKNVMFTFREQTPDANQQRLRSEILGLPGVYNVGRISPETTRAALKRFWFAEVADDSAASRLVTRLRQSDDIQSADLPAERRLV
jgi:hypothetical protein